MTVIPRHTGWIEVICGSMFSGKTEELIRRLKRAQIARQKVQCFKPSIDNRYSKDHVTSHDASKIQSAPIDRSWQILEMLEDNTRVVGIDEVQFFDENIVEVCQKLANRGIRVVIAGLDMDYRGVPFEPMPRLLATAEYVTKLSAICVSCGGPASRTQRVVEASERIAVGSKEMYEARCRFCHDPMSDTVQPNLELFEVSEPKRE
ncbi:MAG: thymidine kinase [Bdellovibrionota bacterium]